MTDLLEHQAPLRHRRRYEISVLVFGVQRPQQLVPFAGATKWDMADRLWFGQSTTLDSHHLAAWLAGLGLDVPVGFSVALIPLKTPTQAAIEARSIAALTGRPVVAGLGPGSTMLQTGVRGTPYEKPLEAMAEYVSAMRVLLDQQDPADTVSTRRSYFPAPVGPLPALHAPPVEIGLGVLRPSSAELAGAIADRCITWLLPAEHLDQTIVPRIVAGAGRSAGRPKVVAIVPVAIARPGRDPVPITAAAIGAHLQEPHYRDAVRAAGIPLGAEPGGDDLEVCRQHGILTFGSPADVAAALDRYALAGADEMVLNLSGVAQVHGMRDAIDDVRDIFNHLKETTNVD